MPSIKISRKVGPRFIPVHSRFRQLQERLATIGYGAGSVDGMVMDLGVSSMQVKDVGCCWGWEVGGGGNIWVMK